MARSERIIVTGATGFLGGATARTLQRTRPGCDVLGLGRDRARGAALAADGVAFEAVDLARVGVAALAETFRGATAVVHAAALSSPWGRRADFERANVVASADVASACIAAGVPRLVHVSSPGIYHDGRPRHGIREDDPLPPRAVNAYAATKREAEARVLAATRDGGVHTVILRPRAIFGPGDPSLLPRIAEALRRGRLPRIGDGSCTVDLTYIDNAVHAVLCALDAPATTAGRAYNISNGEPVRIWDVIDGLAAALGVPRAAPRVPARAAWVLAAVCEAAYRAVGAVREPPLLRYGVELLSVDMTLDIQRARDELGYRVPVALDAGLERTFAALSGAR